jgi:hypothetical protein
MEALAHPSVCARIESHAFTNHAVSFASDDNVSGSGRLRKQGLLRWPEEALVNQQQQAHDRKRKSGHANNQLKQPHS